MRRFANLIICAANILLPPRCPVTGAVVERGGMLTHEAWKNLTFIGEPLCARCGAPFVFAVDMEAPHCEACLLHPPHYDMARAALAYDDGSRSIILKFKHGDQMHITASFLPWLTQAGRELLARADIVAPVPLHRWRLLKRRYNQAALLASALGRRTGRPVIPALLRRVRATLPQGHARARGRRANIRNAFAMNGKFDVRGKAVLLVDDVFTTGATVDECARILKQAGAARVDVLTVARIVKIS